MPGCCVAPRSSSVRRTGSTPPSSARARLACGHFARPLAVEDGGRPRKMPGCCVVPRSSSVRRTGSTPPSSARAHLACGHFARPLKVRVEGRPRKMPGCCVVPRPSPPWLGGVVGGAGAVTGASAVAEAFPRQAFMDWTAGGMGKLPECSSGTPQPRPRGCKADVNPEVQENGFRIR